MGFTKQNQKDSLICLGLSPKGHLLEIQKQLAKQTRHAGFGK